VDHLHFAERTQQMHDAHGRNGYTTVGEYTATRSAVSPRNYCKHKFTTFIAQFIAVCSASTLLEELRSFSLFSSQARENREAALRGTPLLIDQRQPSISSDKLSDPGSRGSVDFQLYSWTMTSTKSRMDGRANACRARNHAVTAAMRSRRAPRPSLSTRRLSHSSRPLPAPHAGGGTRA
jgi:hypothetical protein